MIPSLLAFAALGGDTLRGPPSPQAAGDPVLRIVYPLDETLFPPEIPPPTFRWVEIPSRSDTWRIRVRFQGHPAPLEIAAGGPQWSPDPQTWESIKERSRDKPAEVVIVGSRRSAPGKVISRARISIATSTDAVGAPIFYRDVNLPFVEAVKDPSDIRWRFGVVSSPEPPPVVMEKLPVCGNCHSFPRSGDTLAMDVDYANSKGSYVITRTASNMRLRPSDIITWDDYQREDGELTYGLLSQISPDGRWVVSTVKDKSVFVPRPDLAFSQLFFPIKGILAVYDREAGKFQRLPGADDPAYVQSNATWSPDGRWIVFARAPAYDLQNTASKGKVLLTPEECREFTEEGKLFRYDLYRIPFNGGRGGQAEPLRGASGDGRSNYFARYSPDGRWIVFCKANSYMLLQPDSELYLIPAEGGEARRLRCNLSRMNSWHSWSPNGKWLVFSSKAFSDYTQLFLTHIDPQGNSTPPVLLEHFTAPQRAANIPEFINLHPRAIVQIEEQFLDYYSYERAGNAFFKAGDPDNAIRQFRKSLELNPANSGVHQRIGFLLYHVKDQPAEGRRHLEEAIRLDPENVGARYDLARACLHEGQLDPAIEHLTTALRLCPEGLDETYHPVKMRLDLAQALCLQGRYLEAETTLNEALRFDAANARVHYLLALVLASRGLCAEPLEHYERAVAAQPNIDRSPILHDRWGINYARAGLFPEAIRSAEKAWSLARDLRQESYANEIKQRLDLYRRLTQGVTPAP